MDPRPLPPKALRLTGNVCPNCQLPVGMVTYERYDTQVLFCPACESGWTQDTVRGSDRHPHSHR